MTHERNPNGQTLCAKQSLVYLAVRAACYGQPNRQGLASTFGQAVMGRRAMLTMRYHFTGYTYRGHPSQMKPS